MMDLDEPGTVEPDELADEDLLPEEHDVEPGVDANGRRGARAVTALRYLGPATASEIAKHLDLAGGNVSTRLRQLEQAGTVRRTGRMVNPDGARGGPQVEWELMPVNGTPTDPTTALAGAGPVEERLQRLVERLGHANGQIEALENERDAARARADQEAQRARTAEDRRQAAEARAHSAAAPGRIEDLEREVGRLTAELDAAREAPAPAPEPAADPASAPPSECAMCGSTLEGFRDRYFDLLIEKADAGGEEHIFDRIERLLLGWVGGSA